MEKTLFNLKTSLFLLSLFWQPFSWGITVSKHNSIEQALLDNINTHLSVFPAPSDCVVSKHYKKKLEQALQKALHGLGYYRYEVLQFTTIESSQCENWQLELSTFERVRISELSVQIVGEGKNSLTLAEMISTFPLKVGSSLNHKAYDDGKTQLINSALTQGYFDFKFEKKELLVFEDSNSATIKIVGNTGVRYKFGDIRGELDEDILNLVNEARTFETGEPFHAEKLSTFTQQLKQTGYFEQVSLRPMIEARTNERVPLFLSVQSKPRHIVNLGAGASSDTGPRTTINWLRPRLNRSGHSLETELFVSKPEQALSFNYKVPLKNPTKNFITLQMGLKNTDENDTNSETLSLAVKRHWSWTDKDWNNIGFLRYDQESFTQGDLPQQTTTLLIPGITVSRLRNDGGIDPEWGDRQLVTLEGASDSLLSDINLFRVTLQSRWLRSYQDHRLFWRTDLGAIATNRFQEVPSSLRYFAGGDQSIRGFGYQSLSPRDSGNQLVGGKYLYTTSVEYSYALNDSWRLAAFVDAGNASDSFFEDPATGVGLGVHWSTIIGPIRLYVARGNSELESTWRLHFAMGAAL